jgi:hypothetical protein
MQTTITVKFTPAEYADVQWVVKEMHKQLTATGSDPTAGVITSQRARARALRLAHIATNLGITSGDLKEHGQEVQEQ